ncbi:hypothetical protein BH11PLA2_BH11PLA2_22130 [soil metagenome]
MPGQFLHVLRVNASIDQFCDKSMPKSVEVCHAASCVTVLEKVRSLTLFTFAVNRAFIDPSNTGGVEVTV